VKFIEIKYGLQRDGGFRKDKEKFDRDFLGSSAFEEYAEIEKNKFVYGVLHLLFVITKV
jgi:hypothetical protein